MSHKTLLLHCTWLFISQLLPYWILMWLWIILHPSSCSSTSSLHIRPAISWRTFTYSHVSFLLSNLNYQRQYLGIAVGSLDSSNMSSLKASIIALTLGFGCIITSQRIHSIFADRPGTFCKHNLDYDRAKINSDVKGKPRSVSIDDASNFTVDPDTYFKT